MNFNTKSHAQIIPAFLAASLLTCGLVAEAQSIISSYPVSSGDGGFYIGTDSPGNYAGGAVAFTPQQNYCLNTASVELSGYNGSNGQLASFSIFSDFSDPYNTPMPDQPGFLLADGTVKSNDGSQSSFTVNFLGGVNLSAGSIYWLFVQDSSPDGWQAPNGFFWVAGSNPTGEADYNGSAAFIVSGFYPSVDPPAFSIDATLMSVPEPSQYKLTGVAALAGLIVSRWWRSGCKPVLHYKK